MVAARLGTFLVNIIQTLYICLGLNIWCPAEFLQQQDYLSGMETK